MVVGLHGVNGVYVQKYVENHIDQEHEHVQILNQKIMVGYVLDLNEKKIHVRK
jgi:hypothetical protein